MGTNGCSLNWGGLDKAMNKAAHKLADTQGLMESVGEALVSGTLGRFDAEEDPQGNKWEPSRRAREKGGMTLTNKKILRGSIEYAATTDKVMVGSNLAYARIHQKGGTVKHKSRETILHFRRNKKTGQTRFSKKGKAQFGMKATIGAHETEMPARPYLGVSADDLEEVQATMTDFLAEAFKG